MVKQKIGKITESEKEEIRILHERLLALKELELTLEDPMMQKETKTMLCEKINADKLYTKTQYDKKWSSLAKKYSWKFSINGHWHIDYRTNEITLANFE